MRMTFDLPRYRGTDLGELLALLAEDRERAKDYVVGHATENGGLRAELMEYLADEAVALVPGIEFMLPGSEEKLRMVPTNLAHDQICLATLNHRKAYAKMAADCPHLLVPVINHYLRASNGTRRLLRTYRMREGGVALRAFLSDRYRILDHKDVALTALEGAKQAMADAGLPTPYVANWVLSGQRFELTLYTPHIWTDFRSEDGGVNKGGLPTTFGPWLTGDGRKMSVDAQGGRDVAFAAMRIRNSETGGGKLIVEIMGLRLTCKNGQTMGYHFGQVHLGQRQEESRILQPETVAKENAVIFDKVRDAVRAAFDEEKFGEVVAEVRGLRKIEIVGPAEAADIVIRRSRLTEAAEKDILAAYSQEVSSERHTAFDLYQSLTAVARDATTEEKADEVEKAAVALLKDKSLIAALRP